MKNKILSNLSYVLCAGIGLVNFVLFAFPYVAVFVSGYSETEGISGYSVMSKFPDLDGFGAGASVFFQILILILAILMLAFGVCGLLKTFGLLDIFPEQIGTIKMKKIGEYAVFGYAGLNVLLFFCLIMACAANTASLYGYKYGVRLSAGIFITLLFAAAAVAAIFVVPKKFPVDDDAPVVTYSCSKCGQKAKKGAAFCTVCGGSVVEKVQETIVSVCSQCGRKVKKGTAFCEKCGGAIVEKTLGAGPTQQASTFVCSQCGKEADKGAAFCVECGGAVVEKN